MSPPPFAAPAPACLRATADGCTLDVAVQPNARRTGVDGLHDGALRVRLAAPPLDGRANQRLLDWLADELRCPKRALTLRHGAAARRKVVALALPVDIVAAWLVRQLGDAAR